MKQIIIRNLQSLRVCYFSFGLCVAVCCYSLLDVSCALLESPSKYLRVTRMSFGLFLCVTRVSFELFLRVTRMRFGLFLSVTRVRFELFLRVTRGSVGQFLRYLSEIWTISARF